jgi:site-specific DNA-cytosine methylase
MDFETETLLPTMRSNGDAHSGFKDEAGLVAAPLSTNPYADNLSEESKLVAHSLRSVGHDASEDGTGRGTPIVPLKIGVRRLTPLECERLQGFPDDHTRYGIDARGREIELSDSARYFACGNAVTSNVAEFIGIGIKQAVGPERPF